MEKNNGIDQIGETILEAIKDDYVIESADWAVECIERVNSRLQAKRSNKRPFEIHVPWIEETTAFTAPGKHIFISRSLFQLLRDDEQVAFVIAHEMGHHDCGHIDIFPQWFAKASAVELQTLIFGLYRTVETLIYGAKTEIEADEYALNLCKNADYDPAKCIAAFDTIKSVALDMGAITTTYGVPDPGDDSLSANIKRWLSHRQSGYLSIIERKQFLEDIIQGWEA